MSRDQEIAQIEKDRAQGPRWKGVRRPYSGADVYRLRGSVRIEYTLARTGSTEQEQFA